MPSFVKNGVAVVGGFLKELIYHNMRPRFA